MWGSIIGGAASLIGDIFSKKSTQSTNQQSLANQQQLENWETSMSNTAMQRRVTDLKSAGLNPLLAISQGGASTPGMSPVNLQSPGAAFGNLGGQISSAVALQTQQAQIEQLKASAKQATATANKTDAETSGVVPAQIEQIKSQTGLNTEQAKVAHENIQVVDAQWHDWIQQGKLDEAKAYFQGQTNQILDATRQSIIRATNDENFAKAQGARNLQNATSGELGRVLAVINAVMQPVSSAAGAVSKFVP